MNIRTRRLRMIAFMLCIALLSGCAVTAPAVAPAAAPAAAPPITGSEPAISNHRSEADAPLSPAIPSDTSVDEQLAALSLDQKLGQLIVIGVEGSTLDAAAHKLIAERYVGGVILYKRNIETLEQTADLVNELHAANRAYPIPLLLSADQEGGTVNRLPQLGAVPDYVRFGQAGDPALAYRLGHILGDELALVGLNMNYAPMLDIDSGSNNPITHVRSLGADPELVARLGSQTVQGLQAASVIPVVKHFPGHGDTGLDSHLELPVIHKSEDELHKLELIPFARAIADGADAIMIGHLLVPAMDERYPASMSPTLVNDLLRRDMRFTGVVITDDMTMRAITDHYNLGEAAVQSIKAGVDIVMIAHGAAQADSTLDALHQAVREGVLSEERIDESVRRIVALKHKYGLTNETVPAPDARTIKTAVQALSDDLRQALLH